MLGICDTIWNRKMQRSRRQRQAQAGSAQVKLHPSWDTKNNDFSLFDQFPTDNMVLSDCDSPRSVFMEKTGLLAQAQTGMWAVSLWKNRATAQMTSVPGTGSIKECYRQPWARCPVHPQLHWLTDIGREISDGDVCNSLCNPHLTGFVGLCSFEQKLLTCSLTKNFVEKV